MRAATSARNDTNGTAARRLASHHATSRFIRFQWHVTTYLARALRQHSSALGAGGGGGVTHANTLLPLIISINK